ncbi:regulatory protein YycI of two-component signal transduction system YycFG [Melghirimyces profundicolus]|uniref:Regulatory protein YycI of two-component signal transduction system YycFG n=1 Tax=Melghirimyces profundicolus TaxID=1242148 RepID=A0A2T6C298_9BACL|nr:two-component system regulatory protein YycI [Melghirimyces profundicolus]PTX62440.1 regulatory protein YycI of two-component signal transduction system YycFG [Melghirimyces profundicolus]
MDWSRAKSILILAFLALNVFLADQLLTAKGEQAQNQKVSEETQRELKDLIADQQITLKADLPKTALQVSSLEAKPKDEETLLEKDDRWESMSEGNYRLVFHTPVEPVDGLDKMLKRYVPDFEEYRMLGPQGDQQKTFFQIHNGRPIFDSRLIVRLKDGAVKELRLTPLTILENKNNTRTGLSAQDALVRLIQYGRIDKGATVTDVTLGYHGQAYDGSSRFLFPVWRIQTEETTFYINALTQVIEAVPNR